MSRYNKGMDPGAKYIGRSIEHAALMLCATLLLTGIVTYVALL